MKRGNIGHSEEAIHKSKVTGQMSITREELAVANQERRFLNVSSHRISADIGFAR
jgi:hypothetical protein